MLKIKCSKKKLKKYLKKNNFIIYNKTGTLSITQKMDENKEKCQNDSMKFTFASAMKIIKK